MVVLCGEHREYLIINRVWTRSSSILNGLKGRMMKIKCVFFAGLVVSSFVFADEQSTCSAQKGSYISGVVVSGPTFKHGKMLKGVELSHTHLVVKSDQDHKAYDVAIDNVFAEGYNKNESAIPASLNKIKTGTKLSLCGQLYPTGDGIHWVHTNCGVTPSKNKPNGWVKIISVDAANNIEDLTAWCSLWN